MNKAGKLNKTTLAFALAIQLALVGVLLAARAGGVVEPEPFLSFEADLVDSVSVANDEGAVRIVKADDTWQLPDGLPADASKVESVVEKLAGAAGGWPVASRASTAERFEVSEDNHQRHLTLRAGEEVVADIYLGTSPGYRKAHARRVDDDDIYAIPFSNYEAGVEASDWLDKSLLQPKGALAAIRRMDDAFELTKDEEGGWTAADAVLDAGKAETFAGRFTGLSVLGVSDAAAPDEPAAVFRAHRRRRRPDPVHLPSRGGRLRGVLGSGARRLRTVLLYGREDGGDADGSGARPPVGRR